MYGCRRLRDKQHCSSSLTSHEPNTPPRRPRLVHPLPPDRQAGCVTVEQWPCTRAFTPPHMDAAGRKGPERGRQLHGRRRGRAPRLPRARARAQRNGPRDHGRGARKLPRRARPRIPCAPPEPAPAPHAPVGSLASPTRPNHRGDGAAPPAREATGQTKRVAAPATRGGAIKLSPWSTV